MRPVAQRFGGWTSASRTFSAITNLLAVVEGEVGRLFKLVFLVHARSTSSCLPAEIAVDCSYVLDGAPYRPTLRRRVGVSPGLIV